MTLLNNTADAIMSVFTTAIDKLTKLEEKKKARCEKLDAEILSIQEKQTAAFEEATKAANYAKAIRNMMAGGGSN